jgi:Flp pilus assembly protein TadB
VISTTTTAGLGNPFVSVMEDVTAFVTVLVAFLAPLLIPLVLLALGVVLWRIWRAARRAKPLSRQENAPGA